jgi:hypothetical protein
MLAVALVPLAAGPASAAPPANDEFAGAVAISLGEHVTLDTSEATTNPGDEALNANCGAPATNASVWYVYSPTADKKVALDMTASSYSGGFMVFKGTPTPNRLIACGPEVVGLRAHAGKNYYIMVFSDTDVNGGMLDLTLTKAPKPHAHVTVAKHGVAFHGGAARIHGTYSCTHADSFAELDATLHQRAGRVKVHAEAFFGPRCNGKSHRWSARVVSPDATFAAGRATAKVLIASCGLVECRVDRAKRHIHLTWARNPQRQQKVHPSETRMGHPRPLIARQRHWPRTW